ncbi:MAG: hypothetical protein WBD36_01205, partial [Bacteroidota bacterium]
INPFFLGIALSAVAVLAYGIGFVPSEDYFRFSANPFIPGGAAWWIHDSLLLPLLAWILNLNTSVGRFETFCWLFFWLGFITFTVLSVRQTNFLFKEFESKYGLDFRLIPLLLLLLNPVVLVMLNWLGMPDTLTFFLTVMIFLGESDLLTMACSTLIVINHPQGLVISIFIVVLKMSKEFSLKHSVKMRAALPILFSVAGYAFVKMYLYHFSMPMPSGRFDYVLKHGLAYWLDKNGQAPFLTGFSLYNASWFLILFCVLYFFRHAKVYYSAVILLTIAAGTISFFTRDTTRVFSLLTWFIPIHAFLTSLQLMTEKDLADRRVAKVLLFICLAQFLIPKYYSWDGKLYEPVYFFNNFLRIVSSILETART